MRNSPSGQLNQLFILKFRLYEALLCIHVVLLLFYCFSKNSSSRFSSGIRVRRVQPCWLSSGEGRVWAHSVSAVCRRQQGTHTFYTLFQQYLKFCRARLPTSNKITELANFCAKSKDAMNQSLYGFKKSPQILSDSNFTKNLPWSTFYIVGHRPGPFSQFREKGHIQYKKKCKLNWGCS